MAPRGDGKLGNLKGTYFLHTVKALKSSRRAAEAQLPSALRRYLDERILTFQWYPESDHLGLLRALIEIAPTNAADPWAYYGRLAAQRDMKSVYQAFLKPGDPSASFERLSLVWSMGHDAGQLHTKLLGAGEGQLDLLNYDLVSKDLCALHHSFFATVLEMAGAVKVTNEHPQCQGDGAPHCRWLLRWDESRPARA